MAPISLHTGAPCTNTMPFSGACTLLWDPVEECSGVLFATVQLSMLESDTEMIHQRWEAYKRLNMALASTALSITSATDLVLMHDYHLMLLPAMLRDKQPKVSS